MTKPQIELNERKKFVLRNEYFGGILHNIEKMNCDILDPKQYLLLKDIVKTESKEKVLEQLKDDATVTDFVKSMIAKQVLDADLNSSIRIVEHPIILPQGTLAAPLRVYDTYGYQCNLHCSRCLNDSAKERLDIGRRSIQKTEKIMQKFYDAGTMEWRFTGGEPTHYPDILDSIQIAKGLGMGVMLNTNGCWSDNLYEPLLNAGLSEIIISIEGNKLTNDKLRGEGVYIRVHRTMDEIKTYNASHPNKKINVTLNMTVGKENIEDVTSVMNEAGANEFNINFVPARPYGRASLDNLLTTKEFMEFSRTVQKNRELLKGYNMKVIHKNMDLFNLDMPDRSGLPFPFNYSACGALSTGFGLSPDGTVNACSFLATNPNFIGLNLADDNVTVYDAWLDPKMEIIRKAEKVGCANGNCGYYMKQCEGKCTAMVLANGGKIENGKLIGRDRYCFKNMMEK